MDTNTQVKPVETPPAAKAKKPIYKRWWAIALAARRSLSPRPRSR